MALPSWPNAADDYDQLFNSFISWDSDNLDIYSAGLNDIVCNTLFLFPDNDEDARQATRNTGATPLAEQSLIPAQPTVTDDKVEQELGDSHVTSVGEVNLALEPIHEPANTTLGGGLEMSSHGASPKMASTPPADIPPHIESRLDVHAGESAHPAVSDLPEANESVAYERNQLELVNVTPAGATGAQPSQTGKGTNEQTVPAASVTDQSRHCARHTLPNERGAFNRLLEVNMVGQQEDHATAVANIDPECPSVSNHFCHSHRENSNAQTKVQEERALSADNDDDRSRDLHAGIGSRESPILIDDEETLLGHRSAIDPSCRRRESVDELDQISQAPAADPHKGTKRTRSLDDMQSRGDTDYCESEIANLTFMWTTLEHCWSVIGKSLPGLSYGQSREAILDFCRHWRALCEEVGEDRSLYSSKVTKLCVLWKEFEQYLSRSSFHNVRQESIAFGRSLRQFAEKTKICVRLAESLTATDRKHEDKESRHRSKRRRLRATKSLGRGLTKNTEIGSLAESVQQSITAAQNLVRGGHVKLHRPIQGVAAEVARHHLGIAEAAWLRLRTSRVSLFDHRVIELHDMHKSLLRELTHESLEKLHKRSESVLETLELTLKDHKDFSDAERECFASRRNNILRRYEMTKSPKLYGII